MIKSKKCMLAIMLPCVQHFSFRIFLFFVFFEPDITDLELVNRLSNGKVDLTFGR